MGRIALVTGASSGIGRATALLLAKRGYTVVVVARRAEELARLVAEIEAQGGKAIAEALDCGDGDAVLEMAARVTDSAGTPDVVVNSAGAGQWKWIEDTPPAEIEAMMSAPFFSAFHVTSAFMAAMVARNSGVLVYVNSPAALVPWSGATGYTCSRWALRGLHEALRQDLHGTGVQTCQVTFGEVSSAYFDANPNSHDGIPRIASLIPTLSPEQCAERLVRVIERPRANTYAPLMLSLFIASQAVAPWLVRMLVTATQRKRPA